MSKATLCNAIEALIPNEIFIISVIDGKEVVEYKNPNIAPTEEQIQEKLAELQAAEPMRLLRIQRDKKLQESDWRTNNDYPYNDADAWATYRTALRNLPAIITAGNVTAPTIENNSLIFHDWPEQP